MTPTSTTAARDGRSEGEGEKERHRGGEIRHSPMMYVSRRARVSVIALALKAVHFQLQQR